MSIRMSRRFVGVALAVALWSVGTAEADLKSTTIPRYDAAVRKAVSLLRSTPTIKDKYLTLVAYALLKAGLDPSEEPRLADGVALARNRANARDYDEYQGSYVAAVDAMLLADLDGAKFQAELQAISDLIVSRQRSDGAWFDPGHGPTGAGDVSLTQYGILGLWAAQRAECRVPAAVFERATAYLIKNANSDGGWRYHPGFDHGHEQGASSHNMTLAAIGTIGVSRLLLYPDWEQDRPKMRFGALERIDGEGIGGPNYRPKVQLGSMNAAIERGQAWLRTRFVTVPPTPHKLYFFYTLERATALLGRRDDWYTTYGDALLTLQAPDGHFEAHKAAAGPAIGTSFAILYYMRSTEQILKYGKGLTTGGRDLAHLLNPQPPKRKEIGALDDLLTAMEGKDFADLDANPEDVVETIQFSSRDELVGKADQLKILLKSPDADNRQIAYWALSRTGDFNLVPLMLDGLDDPDLSVSVEALTGLRYIARMPKGFNLTLDPLGRLPDDSDEATKLNEARVWKDKASSLWRKWYSGVRPYEERDGLDELALPTGAPN